MRFYKYVLILAAVSSTAHAGSLTQSIGKSISKKATGTAAQRAAAGKALTRAAPRALTAAEKAELQRILRDLDDNALIAIQKKYGAYIPAERMQLARSLPMVFKDEAAYQQYLRRAYPKLSAEKRARVVGNYEKGTKMTLANLNNPRLPRVVAHERIHQLGHPGFRGTVGKDMDEGLTEYLASKIYGDLAIRDLPAFYPRQRRIAEMLSARIGPEKISRAYFSGDLGMMNASLDKQLGRGALARIDRAMDLGDFNAAERILIHGLPPVP